MMFRRCRWCNQVDLSCQVKLDWQLIYDCTVWYTILYLKSCDEKCYASAVSWVYVRHVSRHGYIPHHLITWTKVFCVESLLDSCLRPLHCPSNRKAGFKIKIKSVWQGTPSCDKDEKVNTYANMNLIFCCSHGTMYNIASIHCGSMGW